MRAVVRDDGKEYRCSTHAARDLLEEAGIEPDKKSVQYLGRAIWNVCIDKPYTVYNHTVYGHRFRFKKGRFKDD